MVDNDSIDMDDKCCICFYPLVTEICRLDCNHQFHFNCLTEWQKKKKTQNIICPICQQNTVINTIFNIEEGQDSPQNQNNDEKNEGLNKNIKYEKLPDIDIMDNSLICCNLL